MCIRDRAYRAPKAKGCADCGLADRGLACATSRFRDFGPPRSPISLVDSESARELARNAPLGRSFGDQR
eukprot:8114820-Alexandrium_andersonii.AAC.1